MIDIFLFCFSISREECPVLCTNTEIIVVHLILVILDDIVIQKWSEKLSKVTYGLLYNFKGGMYNMKPK